MNNVANNEEELFTKLIGRILSDNYKLEEKIAAGGMGAVFRAKDLKTNEPVAIKVLSPNLTAKPSFLKRFEREAKVGWMLSHPNIVKVFELGATPDNILFIVMEYVEGIALDDYLEKLLPLTPKHCLEIIKPLASALEMAHKHGVLHRDVKPANILINKLEDRLIIKLVDFGVVKLLEADNGFHESGLTVIGEVFGTPQYMAPEQLMEDPIGPPADIYALGIIVYEMLAGELPFNCLDPKEVYLFKTKKIIPELSKKYSFIPKAFDLVVKKAIDYEPSRRYQNAEEFIKDFEAIVEKYPEGKINQNDESLEENQFSFLEDSEEPESPTSYQASNSSVKTSDSLTSQSELTKVAGNSGKRVKESALPTPSVLPTETDQIGNNSSGGTEKILLVVLIILAIVLAILIALMFRRL